MRKWQKNKNQNRKKKIHGESTFPMRFRLFVNNINSEKDLEQKEMRPPLDS
jgi:hypothetical protein